MFTAHNQHSQLNVSNQIWNHLVSLNPSKRVTSETPQAHYSSAQHSYGSTSSSRELFPDNTTSSPAPHRSTVTEVDEHGYSSATRNTSISQEQGSTTTTTDDEIYDLSVLQKQIIIDVSNACQALASRNRKEKRSILVRTKSMGDLADGAENFFDEIVEEMKSRVPFLYHMMMSVAARKDQTSLTAKEIATLHRTVAVSYSLLLYNPSLPTCYS